MSNQRPSLCNGLVGEYSLALHASAIVVVLVCSLLGAGLPILAQSCPALSSHSFFFSLCKTAATGVLLSVSAIHLINDAVNDFLEPCIDARFTEFYSGYALFFAFVAALLMHAVDLQLAAVTEKWMSQRQKKELQKPSQEEEEAEKAPLHSGSINASFATRRSGVLSPVNRAIHTDHAMTERRSSRHSLYHHSHCCDDAPPSASHRGSPSHTQLEDEYSDPHRHRLHSSLCTAGPDEPVTVATNEQAAASSLPAVLLMARRGEEEEEELVECPERLEQRVTEGAARGTDSSHGRSPLPEAEALSSKLDACHGHSHAIALPPPDMPHIRRIIAAICMEFGVSLHSIFVGLGVGLTTDHDLKPLLIALVFHQLFEGISLGSRLVDAKFKTAMEVSLAMVFSVSAPLGMAAATIAVSVKRDAMSGGGFVLMMAVLNSFCGGILLYLAFNLLFTDFAADLRVFGGAGHLWRRAAMFAALWVGFLTMAAVGKWL